jgi:chemotaxis protein MotB
MAKKLKEAEKKPNHERWLLTYADMITLLMTFFIVLYALSVADKKKFTELSKSLRIAFNGGSTQMINLSNQAPPRQGTDFNLDGSGSGAEEEVKLGEIQDLIYAFIEKENLMNDVVIDMEERGLVIHLSEGLIFASGEATIKQQAYLKLITIGKMLTGVSNYIRVEGHTDNIPMHGPKFRSNWQLSTERATRIVELLVSRSKVNPLRLSAMGYAEYRPIATNLTETGRAQNRRVDIVLMRSILNTTEENRPVKLKPL